METKLKLELSAADLNMVLLALGQLPYNQVHGLIERLHHDAGQQLKESDKEQVPTRIKQVKTN